VDLGVEIRRNAVQVNRSDFHRRLEDAEADGGYGFLRLFLIAERNGGERGSDSLGRKHRLELSTNGCRGGCLRGNLAVIERQAAVQFGVEIRAGAMGRFSRRMG